MTPRGRRAAVRRGLRDDTGASTLEYVGMSAVASVLVVALLLIASMTGVDIATRFRVAVCDALGLSCGGPSDSELALDRTPKEPCTVGSNLMAADGRVDVLVVAAGGGASLLKTRKSDGTWEVTLLNTDDVQATAGVGGGGFVDTGEGRVGLGAEASASGGVTLGDGMTWTGLTGDQAEAIVNDLKPAVQSAPAGTFRGVMRDVWEVLDGPDDLRQPDQVFVQGGITGNAGAQAAFGPAGAGVSATSNAVMGYREDRTKDEYTLYIASEVSLGGDAGFLKGTSAQAGLAGGGVVALTVDKDGNLSTLTYTGQASAQLFATLGAYGGPTGNPVLDDLARRHADGDLGSRDGTRYEVNMSLDLKNERNAQAAHAFLAEAGVSALPGGQPLVNPGTVGAGVDLGQRIYETGTLSVVEYQVDSSRYGAGASGKVGVAVGAQGGLSWEAATATRAQYWDGDALVDLPGCVA